jgi:hypothetical protein
MAPSGCSRPFFPSCRPPSSPSSPSSPQGLPPSLGLSTSHGTSARMVLPRPRSTSSSVASTSRTQSSSPSLSTLGNASPLYDWLHLADLICSAVKTDEGNKAAQFFGFEEAFTEVPDAVNGVVGKVSSLFLVTSPGFLTLVLTTMIPDRHGHPRGDFRQVPRLRRYSPCLVDQSDTDTPRLGSCGHRTFRLEEDKAGYGRRQSADDVAIS